MEHHEDFRSAYFSALSRLKKHGRLSPGTNDPTSVGSHFGKGARSTCEILGCGFEMENPRQRLVTTASRRINANFLVANFLWTIAGGHEFEMIASYNDKAYRFARDESYFEAAFGARLFSPGHQLRLVERRLRADQNNRRGLAMIYLAEDTLVDRLDVPCAIALQFFVRDQKLVCMTIMRSQSAAMIMPYDVFLFTMIQELLAVRLGLQMGPYIHFAASLHYYEDEKGLVDSILAEQQGAPISMPEMKMADDQTLAELVQAERAIRNAHRFGTVSPDLSGFKLDDYWRDFLSPLIAPSQNRERHGYWNALQ